MDLLIAIGAEFGGNAWVALILALGIWALWPADDEYDGAFEGADEARDRSMDEANGVTP